MAAIEKIRPEARNLLNTLRTTHAHPLSGQRAAAWRIQQWRVLNVRIGSISPEIKKTLNHHAALSVT